MGSFACAIIIFGRRSVCTIFCHRFIFIMHFKIPSISSLSVPILDEMERMDGVLYNAMMTVADVCGN